MTWNLVILCLNIETIASWGEGTKWSRGVNFDAILGKYEFGVRESVGPMELRPRVDRVHIKIAREWREAGGWIEDKEGLAAAFGNGLSTACVVNIGAQVTSIVCIEDGVALPSTIITMPYGGEDISRCLLWVQCHHHAWPSINTTPTTKPIDMVMLNKIKESFCQIRVPPMGLFYPTLFIPDEYPPPPRTWFNDYEDMLEDTWNVDLTRRSEMSDGLYLGRIDLQRKLFCSIQLIGGVALTDGLVPMVEDRVLHAIPSNEAIDTVEVLQSRSDPLFVSWKGGTILAILDFSRDAWIHREDWIRNGIHIGSGRKYKDSYFLHAQAMCYINL
ncbi:hypothetical protein HPP92_008237 [Vanilla planifolia]|uniref:Uncharacterized protein n=1 Tax=Vanilla planifolia TaxID=51239 RepID=A0A835V5H5_VANPL|nr:hypothetical protein HPP92_008237 [Vanilla planifolia]